MRSPRMVRAVAKKKAKPAVSPVKKRKSKPRPGPVQQPAGDAERYALALESLNENLYDWDIENDTVYYAPGLYKILGIAPEQMKSPKDWTDRVHADDRSLFKYTLAEHLKGNTPRFSMELRYRNGVGNWRWAPPAISPRPSASLRR
jgi:PAS domain S-box-containing protein